MKILAFIPRLALLCACEDTRSFELGEFEKEVVLNGIISTDSTWDIGLSYTKSIFDDSEFETIEEAEVRVVDLTTGQSFFLDRKKTGNFTRQLNPVEGHEYYVTVNIPNVEEIRARTYVPSVLEVDVNSSLVSASTGESSIEINIEITDNPSEENYYVWELLPVSGDKTENIHASPVSTIPDTQPDDPSGEEQQQGEDKNDEVDNIPGNGSNSISDDNIFSFDLSEDGGQYQKKELNVPSFLSESDVRGGKIANKLILDSSIISEINSDYQAVESGELSNRTPLFELNVMAVSSDLYDYLRSYEDYKKREIKNTSISDPVIIHSNIENGLGIFGGYNLKTFYIY